MTKQILTTLPLYALLLVGGLGSLKIILDMPVVYFSRSSGQCVEVRPVGSCNAMPARYVTGVVP